MEPKFSLQCHKNPSLHHIQSHIMLVISDMYRKTINTEYEIIVCVYTEFHI